MKTLCFFFFVGLTCGNVLSKSELKKCVQTEVGDSNCEKKLVVGISVDSLKMEESDQIEAMVTKVDEDGETKILAEPIKIQLSKSQVRAVYTSTYLKDYNFRPKEKVIQTSFFSCEDGELSSNPTCDWITDEEGEYIENSQGFCCQCGVDQLVGLDNDSSMRGSNCDALNFHKSASAHCFRLHPVFYSAFEVSEGRLDYSIEVKVNEELIQLSPSNKKTSTLDGQVRAEVVGDFFPSTPIPNYSNQLLVIPTKPSDHPMVTEAASNWMLLEREKFSVNDTDCNKIGVGFTAFQFQGSRCSAKIDECLRNQIYDYYTEDVNRLIDGKLTNYLMRSNGRDYDYYKDNERSRSFAELLEGQFSTLISLEIKADDIQFILNKSPGEIDNVTVNSFESNSKEGRAEIQVTNIGALAAEFGVSLLCSEDILKVEELSLFISPLESKTVERPLSTVGDKNQTHSCNITLTDSEGGVTDWEWVQFNTTFIETVSDQDGPIDDGSGNPSINDKENLSCIDYCPNPFDIVCFLAHSCWFNLLLSVALIAIICVSIAVCIKCAKDCFISQIKGIFRTSHRPKEARKYHEPSFRTEKFPLKSKMFLNLASKEGKMLDKSCSIEVEVYFCGGVLQRIITPERAKPLIKKHSLSLKMLEEDINSGRFQLLSKNHRYRIAFAFN